MDDEEWVPITNFIVKYPKGDQIGKLFAYTSMVPFAIITAYITLIIMNRDLRIAFMFVGQCINELICTILKRIVRQERPPHGHVYLKVYGKADHGYGMPSQHSQFQIFFTVFAILYISSIPKGTRLSKTYFNSLKLLLVGACSLIIYSRIYLLYHYWSQCIMGILVGTVWAYIWFQINKNLMEKFLFKIIMNWNISKLLQLNYEEHKKSTKRKKTRTFHVLIR